MTKDAGVGYENADRMIPAEYYGKTQTARDFTHKFPSYYPQVMSEIALMIEAKSIFEFGCGSGRNLKVIEERFSQEKKHIITRGMDIDPEYVKFGRKNYGLNLTVGDETQVLTLEDPHYDLVFTVSVLENIPNPQNIVASLLNMANKCCVFIEPVFGQGTINGSKKINTHQALPDTYHHNYKDIFERSKCKIILEMPLPTSGKKTGLFYRIFVVSNEHSPRFSSVELSDQIIISSILNAMGNTYYTEKEKDTSINQFVNLENAKCQSEESLQKQLDQIELLTKTTTQLTKLTEMLVYLQKRSNYPGQRTVIRIVKFIRSIGKKSNQENSAADKKARKLLKLLKIYNKSNIGFDLDSKTIKLINSIPDEEKQSAIDSFNGNNPSHGFSVILRNIDFSVLNRDPKLALKRVEALVRCSENGIVLPKRSNTHLLTQSGLGKSVFYLMHSRAPIVVNGYSERSQTVLSNLKNFKLNVIGITRIGFPKDLAKFKNYDFPDEEIIEGVRFFSLPDDEGGLFRPVDDLIYRYADEIKTKASIHPPSVIHASSNYINGLAGIVAARKLGVPSIYEVRGMWHITSLFYNPDYKSTLKFKMEEKLEMQAVNEADRVLVISEGVRSYLSGKGIDKNKLFLLPNCVDTTHFYPRKRNRELADALGISNDSIVIGYVGTLVPYEGVDILIQALYYLSRAERSDVKLLIVGDGPSGAGLRKQARELGILDLCIFVGKVSKEEVIEYYSLIDIAPIPRKSGLVTELIPPLKPIEAMAMGCVVMVSKLPALLDLGEPNKSVIQFDSDNVKALVDALHFVVTNHSTCEDMKKNAREWVITNRSSSAFLHYLSEAYTSLGFSLVKPKN